ncbi:tetratricopeptide repeat protein [Polynucleobacter sp. MWH-UH35A]|uniref:tetratricopeptide repeat protein n=1 Tax=Polynucleobacter sp. MWH-UH35A TaxID=1855619 RepID=UPI001BFD22A1|nr:tetratricopeptide repeat protein [Polynucleobacter sp. MWH-UH35A]QWD59716.1 sel1 repeat family protein [Polynucleobacter sp. MWH-UH35A]
MRLINWRSFIRVPIFLLFALVLAGCSDYRKARSAYEAGEYAKALLIFEQLSNAGDSQAQYDLSQMYLQGIGTNKNIEKGWVWMNRAANGGNVQAMLELAVRYQKSPALDNSEQMAFMWFQKAAIAGSAAGQYNLAHLYEDGNQTPVDLLQAYVWMVLSHRSGNPMAASEAKQLKAKLSPAELENAEVMIAKLKKTMP